MIVEYRTAYITSQGELVRVPHRIALHYLRGMFLLDLVSALPLDEILYETSFRKGAVWLGLLKLPRLFRLIRHVNVLTRTKYINIVGVARLLGIMLLITHWAACLWHYLFVKVPDRPETYNNVERVFAVILLSMGACLYAVVVSSITMLVTNMWSMASRHKQRSAMLQDALRYKGASHSMRVRVDEYYDFMAQFDHPGPDGVSLLSELPAALHAEVLSSVFERMLVKVQLFAYCERPFLWRLAQRLRLSLYMPGDIVYDLGSVGHDMYVIWKGAVGLIAIDGCMSALLCNNDHFGELGLMNDSTPRPHRAVALRQCDIMILSLWDLQDAMRDFPDSAQLVKGRARVQLEDHEAGPAVWAASLAAGKTPRHELHLRDSKKSLASSEEEDVPAPDGMAAVHDRLSPASSSVVRPFRDSDSSSRAPALDLNGDDHGSCDADGGGRGGDGEGGRGDDGEGGRGGDGGEVATTISVVKGILRSASLRWLPIWNSTGPNGPGQSTSANGNGSNRGPVVEAMEYTSSRAIGTHGSSVDAFNSSVPGPKSPQGCPASTWESTQALFRHVWRGAKPVCESTNRENVQLGAVPGQPGLYQRLSPQQKQDLQSILPRPLPSETRQGLGSGCNEVAVWDKDPVERSAWSCSSTQGANMHELVDNKDVPIWDIAAGGLGRALGHRSMADRGGDAAGGRCVGGHSRNKAARLRTQSSDGLGLSEEDREDDHAPRLLVLQAQPFLGLDPLGPLFDDVAKAAAASVAAEQQQQRRRMRAGYQPTATASGGANLHQRPARTSSAYGDHDTTQDLVQPAEMWNLSRKVRRSSMRMDAVDPTGGSRRGRLASDGGDAKWTRGFVEGWLGEQSGKDPRFATLERQLAEARRQLASVFENPLQV
ncbi:hypothetical protein VOLCADRAFT_88913 [Volvox carteri f. nagariensis]|uniref:Cyclic nucleotide-binding domain-containing protein n=1 Tax=Volvox carteri f. nagariensis TaxID=3068 RepID=D8TQA5_VOLCA|nr:uncharacterized protein VOLCADRAFT_88913 [Volvox carteri f. nagariensis]EFJ50501.1 hypothetical protein VOLCADRAFT_88913 [Volvox carteri f. nagariensis]|eukprot:XP_002948626.1 hypothetical protein VOLCADRAFT_88913 [Volvox carteri f. nagariensis]